MRAALSLILATAAFGQVTSERLVNAAKEPQNWLTYSGTYMSQRYSPLNQITPANVKNLEVKWVFQAESLQRFVMTPLVVDGIMYVVQPSNDVLALDAKTGRPFWIYRYNNSPDAKPCCGAVNRGVAILGDTLFMATLDAHLIALDAKTGKAIWNTKVAEAVDGYAMTLAPLVVKDKVVIGVAGGEFGIRGFLAAYDAKTGKEAWKFYTIPGPGEPGHETWTGDTWKTGGASAWVTGSYDPQLNLVYWGIGNPGPDWNPAQRKGSNLYSDSVVALDADTGKLKWHFQFTPNDPYDYDAVQIPVLADMNWRGQNRKLMLWANRNGFYYVLDRATGEFLAGKNFVKVTWAKGLDDAGKPVMTPEAPGTPVFPGVQGGTNWYSPAFSPRTELFYIPTWENYSSIFTREEQEYTAGQRFTGGRPVAPITGATNPAINPSKLNVNTEELGHGAVQAWDVRTGQMKWKFDLQEVNDSGLLTTATDLLFSGSRDGYFHALDARNGQPLWKAQLGGIIAAGPMTYQVDGKQYVVAAAGHALFVFGLRE